VPRGALVKKDQGEEWRRSVLLRLWSQGTVEEPSSWHFKGVLKGEKEKLSTNHRLTNDKGHFDHNEEAKESIIWYLAH